MPLSFNGIPDNLRVPLAYIEFDNTRAMSGPGTINYKVLLLGQRLTSGQVAAGVLTRIINADHAEQAFGMGSMLASMFKAFKDANRTIETWAIGLADDAEGVAATGLLDIAGPATASGVINLYIAGVRIRTAITASDTAAQVATKLIAAINSNPRLPVTAGTVSEHTNQVRLTARHKGALGNQLDLRLNYYPEDATPAGLTITITAMASGAGDPDITDALVAMGDEWWNALVNPYTDSSNLGVLQTELGNRFGPLSMKDCQAWSAVPGSYGTMAALGDAYNTQGFTIMGCGLSPTAPWIWASVNCAIGCASLSIDPARPLQNLVLPNLLPPAVGDRLDFPTRNLLLYDGISTFKVISGNQVAIERQITTYKTNILGAADESYLDVETPATLAYLRYSWRTRMELRFPRHKLRADPPDGIALPLGQPIVTPSMLRDETISLFREWEQAGLVEGFDQFVEEILVEIDASDKNRINMLIGPNLVNQLRILAGQIQFVL